MAQNSHAATADAEPLFVCEVLDADEQYTAWQVDTGEPKKTRSGKITTRVRFGIILYVRLISGALPLPVAHVDPAPARHTSGIAHFAPGEFAPTPVQVIAASGHVYAMTLLGSFSALCELPLAMQAMFHPACNAGSEAYPIYPIILDSGASLIDGFRPRNAQLIAGLPPAMAGEVAAGETPMRHTHSKRQARRQRERTDQAYADQVMRHVHERARREFAVHRLIQDLGPDLALDPLLAALNDEWGYVRDTAAYELGKIAQRLPIAPFLSAIQDRSWLNAAVCDVAAHVFLAHIDEVPVAALLDLYASGDAPWYTNVHATTIRAMARLGDRATDEVVALLASVAAGTSRAGGLLERLSAVKALGDLGARAPVEALIASMRAGNPGVATEAARSLLGHPGPVPEEALTEARLLTDPETAARIIYGRVRDRLNVLDQRDEQSSSPHSCVWEE